VLAWHTCVRSMGRTAQVPRAAAMLLLAPGLGRAMGAVQNALGLKTQRQARPGPGLLAVWACGGAERRSVRAWGGACDGCGQLLSLELTSCCLWSCLGCLARCARAHAGFMASSDVN